MIQSRDEMHAQMESVKNYLQAKVIQLERAQMGMLQWQAQVEACVVKIEATLTEMHERQRRNDERSEAVYQACTSAVGNADPATRTALETLAGRVDELEKRSAQSCSGFYLFTELCPGIRVGSSD